MEVSNTHLSHSHSWDNDLEPDPVTGDGDTGKGYIVLAMMELSLHWGEKTETKGHNTRQDKSGNYGRDTSHAKRRERSNHTEIFHQGFLEEVAFELSLGR